MYACLYLPPTLNVHASPTSLCELARDFSPEIEETSNDTVVFSIAPLRKVLGPYHQIASEICKRGNERKLYANLAVTDNPDTSILLARHFTGVTLVTPGEEHAKLASIPLSSLFAHDTLYNKPVDPALQEILAQWGLKTCEDLADMPEEGIAERLGVAGVYLRNLARGCLQRPLHIAAHETNYEAQMDLDHPVELLEPLLFLFGSALNDLCRRLLSNSQATRSLEARLALPNKQEYRCSLEFPIPLQESHTILKLLQLHLERHSPGAAVLGFRLRFEAVAPRRVQSGLFLPSTPQPDKLQVTLARIAGLVGEGNVGTPQLLDTFRPDAFRLTPLESSSPQPQQDDSKRQILRLSMRIFRPAIQAQVSVINFAPAKVLADGVRGRVLERAGPWKTSGEWWSSYSAWAREEWDVELDDRALYRIYCELPARTWYVQGVYD